MEKYDPTIEDSYRKQVCGYCAYRTFDGSLFFSTAVQPAFQVGACMAPWSLLNLDFHKCKPTGPSQSQMLCQPHRMFTLRANHSGDLRSNSSQESLSAVVPNSCKRRTVAVILTDSEQPLLRVKAKITGKNTVYCRRRLTYTAFLTVILALTLKSEVALSCAGLISAHSGSGLPDAPSIT